MSATSAALLRVKTQLEEARIRFNAEGIRSDPDWFQRARYKQRQLGRLHQKLALRRGELARAERAEKHEATAVIFEVLFRRVVAEHMGNETCGDWLREARRRMDAGAR